MSHSGVARSRSFGWAAAALCLLTLLGCEEDVVAVLNTEKAFSLYGVISPQLDSQWVRVFPIEGTLEPDTGERLDAQFVSTNLQTGEEVVWRDSIITDAFDQIAHVFWAPFAAEYGHTYRLVVRRSDGADTRVDVDVPPRTEIVVQPAEISIPAVRIPVLVEGEVPRLLRVEVEYAVGYLPAGDANPTSGRVVVPYVDEPFETSDGWEVPINLMKDFDAVSDSLIQRIERPIDRGFGVVLNLVTLRLIVASEDWNPPGGMFDPIILVQPGTLSNVSNGFGFVGAGYRHVHEWIPDSDALRRAGFRASAD